MSDTIPTPPPALEETPAAPPPTFSRLWQIPLLGVSLAVLAAGVHHIAAGYHPVSFREEVERVQRLHQAGAMMRANAYLLDLLKDQGRPAEERAELHRLLARTVHKAESAFQVHARPNVASILHNFQVARRLGAEYGAEDWMALGDAHLWSDSEAEAGAAYREALRHCPDRPDRIRRRLLELQAGSSVHLSPDSLTDLDAILNGEPDRSACPHAQSAAAEATSPVNYLWALECKVEWLLEGGRVREAREHVEAGRERLIGTAEALAVSYLDARCLYHEDRKAEAETALRSLLNGWTVRDDLWAKSNWLLGRLQQEDDRPQAGLSFYEEVLRSFQTGEVRDACMLGKAESLAALEEFDESLATFAELKDRLLGQPSNRYVDRDAVRTTVTSLGESLFQQGREELGVRCMELALSLVDASERELRVHYLWRTADSLRSMAKQAMAAAAANGQDEVAARDLFAKTAETYLTLADQQTLDEEASVQSLELSAECFDQAGRSDREIEVLVKLARERPAHPRRVTTLHRLGSVYQAEQRYAEAVAAYEEAITSYPRLPDALHSMVPMAQCLIAIGGQSARKGVEVLVTIVDDKGPEALFAPEARDYRQSLFLLAEYYSRAAAEEIRDHLEKAISRLEEAVAHYPEDPKIPKLTFLLADAYRRSGGLLREEAESLPSDAAREEARNEARRRMERALVGYEKAIALLAPLDASGLSELEQTYLRMSYLYRGDCLFDLERYGQAVEAYQEAAWRYEDLPAALSASAQVVHCYLRLGQPAAAGATLARMKWLLRKIPSSAFDTEPGMSSKEYWQAMVDRTVSAGLD
jgi:tetratricopeptide (TPR) repeat protein